MLKIDYANKLPGKDGTIKTSSNDPTLRPLPIGTSRPAGGQRVYAIGNPFDWTIPSRPGSSAASGARFSRGILVGPLMASSVTDAAINPGNSGVPCWTAPAGSSASTPQSTPPLGPPPASGSRPRGHGDGHRRADYHYRQGDQTNYGNHLCADQAVEQLGLGGVLVLDAREGGPAWRAASRRRPGTPRVVSSWVMSS